MCPSWCCGRPQRSGRSGLAYRTHAKKRGQERRWIDPVPPSVSHLPPGTPKGQGRAGQVALQERQMLLASRRLLFWPHLGGIIVDHRAGYRARREFVGAGLGNRGDLGAGAGNETFIEAG
jgi:hypothetical protein